MSETAPTGDKAREEKPARKPRQQGPSLRKLGMARALVVGGARTLKDAGQGFYSEKTLHNPTANGLGTLDLYRTATEVDPDPTIRTIGRVSRRRLHRDITDENNPQGGMLALGAAKMAQEYEPAETDSNTVTRSMRLQAGADVLQIVRGVLRRALAHPDRVKDSLAAIEAHLPHLRDHIARLEEMERLSVPPRWHTYRSPSDYAMGRE